MKSWKWSRSHGETGSHRKPRWSAPVDSLGGALDDAIQDVVGERSLADLLDEGDEETN